MKARYWLQASQLMRMVMVTAFVVSLTFFASAGPDSPEQRFDQDLKRADADGDGALSVAEAATLRGPFTEHFSEIDSNHDGRITREEMLAWLQANSPPGGGGRPPAVDPPVQPASR